MPIFTRKDGTLVSFGEYDLFKDYLRAINYTKKNLMDSDDPMWEKKYNAFMVNKILSGFSDTIMLANEMNRNYLLDRDMQSTIKKYNFCKMFNCPPFPSLNQTPGKLVDDFMEIELIMKTRSKENGR